MIEDILNEVKSPFTDELIQELIEKYISCGCMDDLLYNEINGDVDKITSTHTMELINRIYSQGIEKSMALFSDKKEDISLIYKSTKSWVFVYSNEDPLKDNPSTLDNQRPLIYRIYLNLKDKQKVEFIENYVKRFQESKIPFEFKFSNNESRLDQIILRTTSQYLEENVLAVRELTKDMKLGKLPLLVGEYKNNIGISEEYYNRLYSPTSVRLALIRSSVKKYLADHIDEFEIDLSDKEKEEIDVILYVFNSSYKDEKEKIKLLGEIYKDKNKLYYQEKDTLYCAKEHIENSEEAYTCGTGLEELSRVIKQIYSNNPEQFVSEVTKNFRLIGTKVWGFSKDFVFSSITEKTIQSKENKEFLNSKQIGSQLEVVSRKGLVDDVQKDLISLLKQKQDSKEINKR